MYPMIPDDGTDEEKAMATVNPEMVVDVNMPALLTSDFVDDAATIVLLPGENMPFAHVDWSAPQAHVVMSGATFLVTPVQIGANQVPIPVGDPVPVTCGPFRCAEGTMEAPEVTIEDSMKCTMWEPTLELTVGLIDNSLDSHIGAAYVSGGDNPNTDDTEDDFGRVAEVTIFDGLDLGWTYTSGLDIDITHDLSVVSAESKGVKMKSTATPLTVGSIGKITLGRDTATSPTDATKVAASQVYYALSNSPEDDLAEADDITANRDALDKGACQPVSDADLWDYNDNVASRVSRPDDCFRITVDNGLGRNYLDAYTVTMAPKGADVAWGKIAWEAWEELTCPDMSFSATDQVDVCELFEAEVERLPLPTAEPIVIHSSLAASGNIVAPNTVTVGFATDTTLAGFDLKYEFGDEASVRHQFASMWFLDDTTSEDDDDMWDLYYNDFHSSEDLDPFTVDVLDRSLGTLGPSDGAQEINGIRFLTGSGRFAVNDPDSANTGDDFRSVWIKTLDADSDPIYGDLGKVTFDGGDKADNFSATDDSNDCTADDGGSPATGKDGAEKNSTLCDAYDVEISSAVTFIPAMGDIGCDPITVSYILTCDWDADGNMKNSVAADPDRTLVRDTAEFVSCEVERE